MNKWLKQNKSLLLRLGIGGFFLANSIAAFVEPDEFKEIIEMHSVVSNFGSADFLVFLIGVNDGLLSLLLFSGRYKKIAAIWGSLWMAVVAYVTGFWTPDFLEHAAVASLLGSYYSEK